MTFNLGFLCYNSRSFSLVASDLRYYRLHWLVDRPPISQVFKSPTQFAISEPDGIVTTQ